MFWENLYELTKEQKLVNVYIFLNTTFNWFDMIVKSSPEKIDESIGYIKGLERYMLSLFNIHGMLMNMGDQCISFRHGYIYKSYIKSVLVLKTYLQSVKHDILVSDGL